MNRIKEVLDEKNTQQEIDVNITPSSEITETFVPWE